MPDDAFQSVYPRPDRSGFRPNLRKTAANEVLDVGWAEGHLSDGRPFRVECWALNQTTNLTIFWSTSGIDHLNSDDLKDLLVREGLLTFKGQRRIGTGKKWIDPSGNEMYSFNVVVGDDEETFVEIQLSLNTYSTTD